MREGDGRLYCWNWEACNGDLYRCSPQWVDGGGMGACRVTSISCGSRHLAALTGASSKATREAHENPNENILDIARLKPFCRFESVVELSLGGLKGEIINTGGWKDEEEERLLPPLNGYCFPMRLWGDQTMAAFTCWAATTTGSLETERKCTRKKHLPG
eukprot:GHVT01095803.1.p2 GENE.GHVT01095803.1~~GHVT01095803.1.p2  ORF type:complete len:159 (-),score=21.12 GHVT01095803.1:245-721(-)